MQLLVQSDNPIVADKLEAHLNEIAAIIAKLKRRGLSEGKIEKLKYRLGVLRGKTLTFIQEG